MAHNRPNPDDRSDNVEKLQSMIVHTIENMDEAEESMKYANAEDLARIEAKNERRRESLDAFRSEIKDEYEAQQNGNSSENNNY
ncbi:small acid-soluble spore protein Tlp [Cytobacillus firmus]|uniref:Small, acid-soluble spore protein Tlp n=1 Tax=Cytobacillus firmus TaxID=1399 RepID=A0A380XND4_CYTFI|nr:small acid-soluble spore protein Tlp [Cytobacillus firmus]KAF0823898.1 Small, acid-soluble spore protein Tlp [Cytobacillus firmus]MBG9543329.1 small acid-soluble spore protein Tlp [Cytobacillus firmus]MBG9550505.1 small acid-soluble spore protein Tlp [Cytobacillus firmus]MBG9553899.1 small acid-soluble spore protein Tlp [Cytobacillus firmus]MBG9558689.1 small acid-soluble spore protein Tlp [Cytobacillus firmus]